MLFSLVGWLDVFAFGNFEQKKYFANIHTSNLKSNEVNEQNVNKMLQSKTELFTLQLN